MPDGWQTTAGGKAVRQDELNAVAQELLAAAGEHRVWLFYGEMGSGKTTLIKAIGTELQVQEGMSSPTFSIINEYKTGDKKNIYHFDLYRLTGEKEVFDIGTEEYFDSGGWCMVEWPEKLGELTPDHYFKIRITPSGADHRKIEYQRV